MKISKSCIFNCLFYVFYNFTYWPEACQIDAHSSKINQRENLLIGESPIFQKNLYSSHEFVFTSNSLMLEYFLGAFSYVFHPCSNFFVF